MWSLMYPLHLTSRLDGVCLNASNDEARGFPKVQGHSALNNKYQDNQDCIVRIFSKLTSEKQKSQFFFGLHSEGLWSFASVLIIFPVSVAKYCVKSNVRKGFILALGSRVESIMAEKSKRQKCEAADHITCAIRKQREINAGFYFLPPPPLLTNIAHVEIRG